MYIKAFFKHHTKSKPIKEYKDLLKDLTNMNLRRTSKYNALAIYGALKCVKNIDIPHNLDIYSSSEHGAIKDISVVLEELNSQFQTIMPFDFLAISSSNIGFYISKALDSVGNNISITSKGTSFIKAIELAYNTLQSNNSQDILVGYIDEALDELNHEEITANKEQFSYDKSYWVFLSNNNENALLKIDSLDIFNDLDKLEEKLSI